MVTLSAGNTERKHYVSQRMQVIQYNYSSKEFCDPHYLKNRSRRPKKKRNSDYTVKKRHPQG